MQLQFIATFVHLAVVGGVTGVQSGGVTVSYFGYGSNMAASVREGRRGLRPLSTRAAVVRDHRLAFNVGGFASLMPSSGDVCHGALIELGVADWLALCASEGVGFSYQLLEVEADPSPYRADQAAVRAWTLSPGLLRTPEALVPPSQRYMRLLMDGARELELDPDWQARLAAQPTAPDE